MKPKKQPSLSTDLPTKETLFSRRDGLAAYTIDPASFPNSRVIYFNEKFTVIYDLFPKSVIHVLILPRDPKKSILRPQEAFDDPEFLEDCKQELKKVHGMVASELQRNLGKFSKKEQARIRAMDSEDIPGKWLNQSLPLLGIAVRLEDVASFLFKCMRHCICNKSYKSLESCRGIGDGGS